MNKLVLITGGAGFIGSHLADHLSHSGYVVRVLDVLLPCVHGPLRSPPESFNPAVELLADDIRDADALRRALKGASVVVHLAATPPRNHNPLAESTSGDVEATAHLLKALIQQPVERLVVASGTNVYGEGMYQEADGRLVPGQTRSPVQLRERIWDLWTDTGQILLPVPTPEHKRPSPASVHALFRFTHEQLCLLVARQHRIPTVILRLSSVYGPHLNLSCHHARGVFAGFASRLLRDRSPLIFEDGYQQRDFVSAFDVARAFRRAIEVPDAVGQVFNIGSGVPVTIRELAARLADHLGKEHIELKVTQRHRSGDVRHCFVDIRRARDVLGFEPAINLEQGLNELAGLWRHSPVHSR